MASGIKWVLGDGTIADDGKPYFCTYNEWTMTRYRVEGVWKYILWRGKKMVGFYGSTAEVNAEVHKLEKE